MGAKGGTQVAPESTDKELHAFMMGVRDALLMIVRWIERVYGKR